MQLGAIAEILGGAKVAEVVEGRENPRDDHYKRNQEARREKLKSFLFL